MEWGAYADIALGAILGSGSTLSLDWIQARRNTSQQQLDAKREVYRRFLTALAEAHSRMTVAAFNGLRGEERSRAVHEAFHSDPQGSVAKAVIRELGVTAPDEVFQPARESYDMLRDLRNILAHSSITANSPEYKEIRKPFFTHLEALQDVMREDLRLAGLRSRRHEPPLESEIAAEFEFATESELTQEAEREGNFGQGSA